MTSQEFQKEGGAKNPSDKIKTFSDKHLPVLDLSKPDTMAPDGVDGLIVLFGDLPEEERSKTDELQQVFSRGLVPVANQIRALVVDRCGQDLSPMIGTAVAHRNRRPPTACVVSSSNRSGQENGPERVDPEHDFIVCGDANERAGIFQLMTRMDQQKRRPMAGILIGGDETDAADILRAVRQGRQLIIMTGTGGLADQLGELILERDNPPRDPALADIVLEGRLVFCDLSDGPIGLEQALAGLLQPDESLRMAWQTFSVYDLNAIKHQRFYHRMQNAVLILTVTATMLALTHTALFTNKEPEPRWLFLLFHYTIICIPILISILVAAISDFKSGQKYISLRAGAETVKRDIFQYRTRTGPFKGMDDGKRRIVLAERVKAVGEQMMSTNVSESALVPYTGSIPPTMYGAAADDDGLSYLLPDDYVTIRLGDQMNYYQLKANRMEKQLKKLQWVIYFMGGMGTLLAAVGLDLWIPLATSIFGAVGTYLEYQQIAETLTKYNHAARDLSHTMEWWRALGRQATVKQIDALVNRTEDILARELAEWVSRMQEAIEDLEARQKGEDKKGEGAEVEEEN